MSASKRISPKLQGGRKGAPTRGTVRSNEIDPGLLGSITLNRDAIQALTIAQARVQVSIGGGGTTAILISEETGKQIGGLDDLTKLLGLRTFVTKEKKMSASSEMQQGIMLAAFRANQALIHEDSNFKQKKLDSTFVVAAKPYMTMTETMLSRYDAITENYHDGSGEFKDLLTYYCKSIGVAASSTLKSMVKGEKEKGILDSLLFDEGVPAYVKNKLLMKSLVINKDTDLSRVLFPQDPAKGLAFTVKEWRSPEFLQKQGSVIKNSAILVRILQDDDLFLELIGMSAERFSNAEDPQVQRVLKTRILVVPPFEDHKRVLDPLSRANFRGFGLPNTAMDQQRDRLANLCAVPVRAYAFSVRMAETRSDFFDRIMTTGTIQPVDDKLGNYAKQTLDALDKGTKIELLEILRLENKSTAMMEWIHRECKIIPNGDLSKQISAVLGFNPDIERGINPAKTLAKAKVDTVRAYIPLSTGTEKDAFKSFRQEAFSIKEKSSNKKRTVASSVLLKEAKTFLKMIAKSHSPLLAEAMESYFRGFYSTAIQAAAVRIAEARFDELDEVSDLSSTSSSSEDEEED